jgi:hypothetical protein
MRLLLQRYLCLIAHACELAFSFTSRVPTVVTLNIFSVVRRVVPAMSTSSCIGSRVMSKWKSNGARGNWRRFIDQPPEHAELADSGNELFEVDGFYNICIGAEAIAFHKIVFLAG